MKSSYIPLLTLFSKVHPHDFRFNFWLRRLIPICGRLVIDVLKSVCCYCVRYNNTIIHTVSPDGSLSVTPVETCAERNEEVMFTCSASQGIGNTFSWEDVATGDMVGIGEVLIVTAQSAAQYKCTVLNVAGSGCITATLLCKWKEFLCIPWTCILWHGYYDTELLKWYVLYT